MQPQLTVILSFWNLCKSYQSFFGFDQRTHLSVFNLQFIDSALFLQKCTNAVPFFIRSVILVHIIV